MKKQFVDICEGHIKYWHQLKFTKTMDRLPPIVVNDLLSVFEDHLKSREPICKWCPESHSYLVRQVFQSYERDAANPILDCSLKTSIELPNENKVEINRLPVQSVPQSVPVPVENPETVDLPPITSQEILTDHILDATRAAIDFYMSVDNAAKEMEDLSKAMSEVKKKKQPIKVDVAGQFHIKEGMTGKGFKHNQTKNNGVPKPRK